MYIYCIYIFRDIANVWMVLDHASFRCNFHSVANCILRMQCDSKQTLSIVSLGIFQFFYFYFCIFLLDKLIVLLSFPYGI